MDKYEKKYNEILAWAKKYKARLNGVPIEEIFPELRESESEDERIRKVIFKLLLGMREEIFTSQDEIVTKEKALAYLEKKPGIKIWPHPIKDAYLEQQVQKPEDKNLDEIARDYIDGVKEYNPEPTWDLMQTAVCYGYHYREQKEQIPYTDFVIKPHKGDDNNPYDMRISEAQEYAIKRGFGVPFNDGEVYVDERHLTQTIGNILRWADEHPKEQKELPLMDGNSDLYFDEWNQQKQNPTKRQCFEEGIRYAQRLQKEQKPLETPSPSVIYTEQGDVLAEQKPATTEDMPYITDEHFYEREPADSFKYKLAEYMTKCCTKKEGPYGYEYGISAETILKMAKEELLKRGVVQKPAEWSEEDETHLGWIIECFDSWKYQVPEFADQYQSAIDWLKSLRPSWKPSEEHLSALLAVFNDPDNIGSQTCQLALTDLYEQLLKLK